MKYQKKKQSLNNEAFKYRKYNFSRKWYYLSMKYARKIKYFLISIKNIITEKERERHPITCTSVVNTGAHNYLLISQWRLLCGDKIRHIRRCCISVSDTFLYDIAVRYFIFNRRQYVKSGQSAFLSNGVSLRRDVQFPSCSRYRCIQKMSMYMYNGDMYGKVCACMWTRYWHSVTWWKKDNLSWPKI